MPEPCRPRPGRPAARSAHSPERPATPATDCSVNAGNSCTWQTNRLALPWVAVLGLAALAVQIVVQRLGMAREIGYHVAGVVALLAVLPPRDHPALPGPALRRINKLAHLALFEPGGLKFILHGEFEKLRDSLQSRIARQAKMQVRTGTLAVVDDALPAKARVAS